VKSRGENAGEGKYVFDDTMVVPDKYKDQENHFVQEAKKVASIIRARYIGGFMKLYLGSSDDASTPITSLPRAVSTLRDAYDRVVLVNGGGVHSPEYYVVFGMLKSLRKGSPIPWAPPKLNVVPHKVLGETRIYDYGGSQEVENVEQATANYLQTWITLKIYDVLRANVHLSVQVRSGCLSYSQPESWLESEARQLLLGGTETFASKTVVDKSLESFSTLDLGDGPGVIPSAAPPSSSSG